MREAAILDHVLDTIGLAGRALNRLPPERLKRAVTLWPAVVHDSQESYGYGEGRPFRPAPTRSEVTALDELAAWLWLLEPDERRVVVARGMGLSWRAISRASRERRHRNDDGTSPFLYHARAKALWESAIVKIVRTLMREATGA